MFFWEEIFSFFACFLFLVCISKATLIENMRRLMQIQETLVLNVYPRVLLVRTRWYPRDSWPVQHYLHVTPPHEVRSVHREFIDDVAQHCSRHASRQDLKEISPSFQPSLTVVILTPRFMPPCFVLVADHFVPCFVLVVRITDHFGI